VPCKPGDAAVTVTPGSGFPSVVTVPTSAPYERIAEELGFTPEKVAAKIREWRSLRSRSPALDARVPVGEETGRVLLPTHTWRYQSPSERAGLSFLQ
jgi:hypothetical protein